MIIISQNGRDIINTDLIAVIENRDEITRSCINKPSQPTGRNIITAYTGTMHEHKLGSFNTVHEAHTVLRRIYDAWSEGKSQFDISQEQ